MTITLLHPSRSRPEKSFETINKWAAKSTGMYTLEAVVSIDLTDPFKETYLEVYRDFIGTGNFQAIVNDNKDVVQATNAAAKVAKGDILIYLSDDFDCPHNWDELVVNEFDNLELPRLLKVNDCLQKFNVPVLTIPIMNRALYNKLGYFWHPEYKSMFVDCDLYEVCARNGFIREAPYLKFPHLHHSIGQCENDETYRRSEANWNQGQAIFNRRKRENFPI